MKFFLFSKKTGSNKDVVVEEMKDTDTVQKCKTFKDKTFDYLGCIKGTNMSVIPDTLAAKLSLLKEVK